MDKAIDESNKGYQLLKKLGWTGTGLGAKQAGIAEPIKGGEIRSKNEQFLGVGKKEKEDEFAQFRQKRSESYRSRFAERAAERSGGAPEK